MNTFKPIFYRCEDIGSIIKKSSKRFSWKILIDSEEISVELICVLGRNQRIIFINNTQVFSGTKPLFKDFNHTFNMKKHIFTIENNKKTADLIIDSISFNEVYNKKLPNWIFEQKEEKKPFSDEKPVLKTKLQEDFPQKKEFNPQKNEIFENLLENYNPNTNIFANFIIVPSTFHQKAESNKDFNQIF